VKRPDRRKQRTQQLLRDALIELILEKGYDAVTVQEITDRANLGRATFYLHYPEGKEQLFLAILKEMFDDLKSRSTPVSREEFEAGDNPMRLMPFQHVLEYRDLYRATLLSQDGMAAIMNGVREYLATSLQERIEPFMSKDELPIPLEALANYLSGAMISLVSWWLRQDQPYSAEEMSEIFFRLSRPTINALMEKNTMKQPE
jgi:AcrR family transcriptional regulator